MKHLIYITILLGVVNSASGQTLRDYGYNPKENPATFTGTSLRSQNQIDSIVMANFKNQSVIDSLLLPTDTVILKIILSNKTSVHFYRKGLKRGDQYWYFDRNRIKKLPGNWFVWEYRKLK